MDKNTYLKISAALLIGLVIGFSGSKVEDQKISETQKLVGETHNLWPSNITNSSYLAKNSDLVIKGTVSEVHEARWTTSNGEAPEKIGNHQIYHPVDINVSDTWKGRSEKEVTVQVKGGTSDNISMHAPDAPSFIESDEVIVFLKEQEDDAYEAFGMQNGVFHISDQKAVRRNAEPKHRTENLSNLKSIVEKENN